MSNAVAVVVGARGAVGAAWLAQLEQSGRYKALVALGRHFEPHSQGRIHYRPIDFADESTLAAAADTAQSFGDITRILVATGILQDDKVSPEKSWRSLSPEKLAHYFLVNSIGPALVAKYFLPKLPRDMRSDFAVLSARVGSISDNHLGGWYGYRASKAALNQLVRTCALELARSHPQAVCVSLHPGTVDSPLSAPFQRNLTRAKIFTAEDSARQMLSVLDNLRPEQSGGFFAYDGQAIAY